MTSGVYQIVNTVNGKVYIGSAANIQKRWAVHRCYLAKGQHHSRKLQRAVDKYGVEVFEYAILENCPVDACVQREQHYIDACDAVKGGYNIRQVAESNAGIKRSAETRAKLSKAWETRAPMSDDTKQKIARAGLGRKHTAESIEKMRVIQKQKSAERAGTPRKPLSAETKAKISAANTGKRRAPEVVARIAKLNTGKTQRPETIAARRAAWLATAAKKASANPDGRVRTKEQDEKMIATRRARREIQKSGYVYA